MKLKNQFILALGLTTVFASCNPFKRMASSPEPLQSFQITPYNLQHTHASILILTERNPQNGQELPVLELRGTMSYGKAEKLAMAWKTEKIIPANMYEDLIAHASLKSGQRIFKKLTFHAKEGEFLKIADETGRPVMIAEGDFKAKTVTAFLEESSMPDAHSAVFDDAERLTLMPDSQTVIGWDGDGNIIVVHDNLLVEAYQASSPSTGLEDVFGLFDAARTGPVKTSPALSAGTGQAFPQPGN